MTNRSNSRRQQARISRIENSKLESMRRKARECAKRLGKDQSAFRLTDESESSATVDELVEAIRSIVEIEMLLPLMTSGRKRRKA